MRTGKILAIAVAAVFCLGFASVLTADNASAADPKLTEGSAYGQSLTLDMKTLDPALREAFGLKDGDDLLKAIGEAVLGEMTPTSAVVLKDINLQTLDFNFVLASLAEVVKANDTDGYVIDYSMGFVFSAKMACEVSGKLPKAGTYNYDYYSDYKYSDAEVADRTVKGSAEVSMGVLIRGTLELTPAGELKCITINIDAYLNASLTMGVKYEYIYGADPTKGPEKFKITYTNVKYEMSSEISLSTKLSFEADAAKTVYSVKIDELGVKGKIALSDDLKSLIDNNMGEPGYADKNILNASPGGLKLVTNGELKTEGLIADPNKTAETLNGGPLTIPYIDIEDMEAAADTMNPYDVLKDSPVGDMLVKFGMDDMLDDLKVTQVTNDEAKEIKKALGDVGSNIDKNTGNKSGGGKNNTLLYVGVAVVAIGIVACIGYFVFLRKP